MRVWDSRLLRVSAGLAGLAAVFFAVELGYGPVGPVVVAWLVPPASAAVAAVLVRRTGKDLAVAAAARRFWRTTGLALGILALAQVSLLADALQTDLTLNAHLGLRTSLLEAAGTALLVWPLFRLPIGAATRAARIALGLDVGILMVGAAIFFWHYAGRPAVAAPEVADTNLLASVAFMVLGLIGALGVAKVAITGSATIEPAALRALGVALTIGGVGSALAPLLNEPHVDVSMVVVPMGGLLFGLGARYESAHSARSGAAVRHRRYSVLPYVIAAATDGLLIQAIIQDSRDLMAVAVAAVLVTALVVLRQLSAFRENDKLLTRLDADQAELAHKEQRFRLLVQNSTDVVTITEVNGRIKYISPAVLRVLGSEPGPMVGTNIAHRVHPDDRAVVAEHVGYVAAAPGNTAAYRARLSHADGTWRWLEIISANLLAEPSVAGIVTNSRDVTETLQVQERLSYEASHDVLTGLANRALFNERVEAGIAGSGPGHPISIVLIDLDDFKTVNDTLGHAVGDGLLVTVAERMRAAVRPTDTVARLGGDEFAILFEGLAAQDVDKVLLRLTDTLIQPMRIDDHQLRIRASFGVVDGTGADDAGDLLRRADIVMYEAKERGDGGTQRYRPGMQARGVERSRLTTALRAALDNDELVLHYQPVVTLPGGRITGAEALIRWQHPDRGLIGPGDFIDAAEETGLIVPVGRWVLRTAVRQAAAWRAAHGTSAPATMSVNVSARQLREAGFAGDVFAVLAATGLPAHRLTIEITESTAVGGGATQETLHALRDLGVRLSLDDFGTGQSTLSLLASCPVDQIKLDRSFVPGPGPDAIARAVLQLSQAFEIEAVAEGVETAEQAETLYRLGYRRAQGFHFARPLTVAGFAERLTMPAAV